MPGGTRTCGHCARAGGRATGKVAIEELPKAQPSETARLLVPNGDVTIGTGLGRSFTDNQPADKVFKEVAQQLGRDGEGIKEQVTGPDMS